MTTITTKTFDRINQTPAVALLSEAQAELMLAGLMGATNAISWDHKAVVAFQNGKPVGVISFAHTEWLNQVDIILGFTLPSHRRLGIYRAMWDVIVAWAVEKRVPVIIGTTSIRNQDMRRAAASLNRKEDGVILKFEVPLP